MATPAPIDPLPIVPAERTLLTPEQTASYLGTAPQTLANWRVVGRGPKYVRVGKLIRYRLADIDNWLTSQSDAGS